MEIMNYDQWKLQGPDDNEPLNSDPDPEHCDWCGEYSHPEEVVMTDQYHKGQRMQACIECLRHPDLEGEVSADINAYPNYAKHIMTKRYPDLFPNI